jgi:hypothetical protein
LSLNACPNGLNLGQESWQAEHGIEYFRANAGSAKVPGAGMGAAETERVSARNPAKINAIEKMKYRSRPVAVFLGPLPKFSVIRFVLS